MIPKKIIDLLMDKKDYYIKYGIWGNYTLPENDIIKVIEIILKEQLSSTIIGDVFKTQPITEKILSYCRERFRGTSYNRYYPGMMLVLSENYKSTIFKNSIENEIKHDFGGIFERNNKRGFYALIQKISIESTKKNYISSGYLYIDYNIYNIKYLRDYNYINKSISQKELDLGLITIFIPFDNLLYFNNNKLGTMKIVRVSSEYCPKNNIEENLTLWRRL